MLEEKKGKAMNELKLVVLRGLPGSGKSRYIRINHDPDMNPGIVVCSADHFFMVDGQYKFQPYLIGQAHEECKRKVLRLMLAGCPTIIIDNTNTQKWEYALYLDMAAAFGYKANIVEVGDRQPSSIETYAKRNIHGVPRHAIEAMARRWEE